MNRNEKILQDISNKCSEIANTYTYSFVEKCININDYKDMIIDTFKKEYPSISVSKKLYLYKRKPKSRRREILGRLYIDHNSLDIKYFKKIIVHKISINIGDEINE